MLSSLLLASAIAGGALAQTREAQSLADRFAREGTVSKPNPSAVPSNRSGAPDAAARDRAAVVQRQIEIAAEEKDLEVRETEMLARARAEADAGARPEAPEGGADIGRTEAARILEQHRLGDLTKTAEAHGVPDERAKRHEEELAALSERIRKAQARRAAQILARGLPRDPVPMQSEEHAASEVANVDTGRALGSEDAGSQPPASGTATVLLVMSPGNTGIRRFAKKADPVLCIGRQCYVSRGADRAADLQRMSMVLGPGNTLGKRAGACNGKLVCVFRGVEIGGSADVMPVDMRILKHDRREVRTVRIDGSCHMDRGRLACTGGTRAGTYTMWVLPEDLARKLSPSVLEQALAAGLPETRTTAAAGL